MSLDDCAVRIVTVVGVILIIGMIVFCVYCGWAEEDAAETIILHDGSQSYACVVSRIYQTPHRCKPIKDTK